MVFANADNRLSVVLICKKQYDSSEMTVYIDVHGVNRKKERGLLFFQVFSYLNRNILDVVYGGEK